MTIDERIEALMHGLELYAAEQAAMGREQAATRRDQAAMGREFSERMDRLGKKMELHAAEQAAADRRLSRAIRLGVQEARRLRRVAAARDAESNARMDRLTAAQERTEASLKAFIDSMRARNGHPPA
ncbi:MAG TPA: hypothetical protein VME43_22360 [Bryobacteraceae bacterium]|nr:hypothetical protein [Bryobacteraceae bacterium]